MQKMAFHVNGLAGVGAHGEVVGSAALSTAPLLLVRGEGALRGRGEGRETLEKCTWLRF